MSAVLEEYDDEATSGTVLPRRAERPKVETYAYMADSGLEGVLPILSDLPLLSMPFAGGEVRHLRRPLSLRVSFEDGEFFVENDALRLFGNGATLRKAVEAFSRDFAYYWKHYRSLTDDEVAGDGVQLKKLYEELVPA